MVEQQLPVSTDEVLANGDRLLARSRQTIARLDELLGSTSDDEVVDIRE